ncbi:hypothetical protein HOY82DRAFT_605872 [Tuber indicum]|nr:hypothetical protein HOY82DRAFT_605872 [Tuber indicum]
MRPLCYLGYDQQSFYSGFKNEHGTKIQSIVTYDRLLGSLAELFPAPKIIGLRNKRLYIYSDAAYSPVFGIMGPFGGEDMTTAEEAVNVVMSGHRIVVE